MQNMSFSRSKKNQNVTFFWMQTFFQNLTSQKIFNSKSNALYKSQSKTWSVVKTSNQNLTRCENFISKSDKFQNFSSENWFLSCYSGFDWKMISSVIFITNLIQRGELKHNACYRVSRQMDSWKLPHSNHLSICEE